MSTRNECARQICFHVVARQQKLAKRLAWHHQVKQEEWMRADYELPPLAEAYTQFLGALGYRGAVDDHVNTFLPGTCALHMEGGSFPVWGGRLQLAPDFPGDKREVFLRSLLQMTFGEIALALAAINHMADEDDEDDEPDAPADLSAAMASLKKFIELSRQAADRMHDPYPVEAAACLPCRELVPALLGELAQVERTWLAVEGEPAPGFRSFRDTLLKGYLWMWREALTIAEQSFNLLD